MEIDRTNLRENYETIKTAIEEASFLSFDFELTGLYDKTHPRPYMFDSVQDRYSRAMESVQKFIPIQLGLCTFKWNEDTKNYSAKPFNFEIFPANNSSSFGKIFYCDSSSLEFLITHSFDFNRLITTGIRFSSLKDSEASAEKSSTHQQRPEINLNEEDKVFLESSLVSVEHWLKAEEQEKELILPSCNAYRLRILYQEVPKKYPTLFLQSVGSGSRWKSMKIAKTDTSELNFVEIIKLITSSKKPLLGHNLLLDLCHFYHSFIAPIPPSVDDFRNSISLHFPVIIDTKYLSSEIPELNTSNTSLGDLFKYFSKETSLVECAPLFSRYSAENSLHEAGFDAYCTGKVFAHAAKIYTENEGNDVQFDKLADVANRIYLPLKLTPFYLDREAPEESHENVFYAFDIDPKVTTTDFHKWFKNCGKVNVFWQNETTAFIALLDPTFLKGAKAFLGKNSRFSLKTYNDYLQVINPPVPQPVPVKTRVSFNAGEPTTPTHADPTTPPDRTSRRSSIRPKKRPLEPLYTEDITQLQPRRKKAKTQEVESEPFSICNLL